MVESREIYETLLDLCRKDKRGRSLDVDEFNRVAKMVDKRVYAHYYSNFEQTLDSSDALGQFKVTNYQVDLTSGVGALPSDYYNLIGSPRYTDGSDIRKVDVVTNLEYTSRQSDYLTRPTAKDPIMLIGGLDSSDNKEVRVLPATITPIRVDYLKESSTPYLDYYIDDTTYEYTFLDGGGVVVSMPSGNTYRDGTQGAANVTSVTVNFDWSTDDIPLLLSIFVQVLGLQLEDHMLIEVGNAEELKNTSR